MLRLILILLLLANGLYFAWSQSYLVVLGLAPALQTEPARMQTQIKPEALRLIGSADTAAARAPTVPAVPANAPVVVAAKPAECLQSAALDDALATKVRSAAGSLPGGSWSLDLVAVPERWIIYMGKYSNPETLAKKKSELRELDVSFETLQNTSLEPGISLGGYETQAQANSALARLNKQGVRTAKVVQEKSASQRQILRLPSVDEALRTRLDAVVAALGTTGLRSCPTT